MFTGKKGSFLVVPGGGGVTNYIAFRRRRKIRLPFRAERLQQPRGAVDESNHIHTLIHRQRNAAW